MKMLASSHVLTSILGDMQECKLVCIISVTFEYYGGMATFTAIDAPLHCRTSKIQWRKRLSWIAQIR